jgi:hypothetical protein
MRCRRDVMESSLCEVECAASSSSMILQKDVLRGEEIFSWHSGERNPLRRHDCRTTTYRVAV